MLPRKIDESIYNKQNFKGSLRYVKERHEIVVELTMGQNIRIRMNADKLIDVINGEIHGANVEIFLKDSKDASKKF